MEVIYKPEFAIVGFNPLIGGADRATQTSHTWTWPDGERFNPLIGGADRATGPKTL